MDPIIPNACMLAHGNSHELTGPWWSQWTFNQSATWGIALVAFAYALGLARLWRHTGWGRGVRLRNVGCFTAGVVALVLSLISPIDTYSDHLASIHMIQHILLMLVAGPLMVAGAPGLVLTWALPIRARRRLGRALTAKPLRQASRWVLWQPVWMWVLFALTLWVWHLPKLYEAALDSERVHNLQHLAFFAAACLYWRVMFDPVGRVKLTPTLGVAYLFTTSLHAMFLGLFMALSQLLWYPSYQATAPAMGISPLEDQQIAGFIMWMPACGIYAGIAAVNLVLWLNRSEPTVAEHRARKPSPT